MNNISCNYDPKDYNKVINKMARKYRKFIEKMEKEKEHDALRQSS